MRINEEIPASRVKLIDENGHPLGETSYDQAMWLAYERGYDLVEVGPNVDPPVARLLDYGKYKYELEKQSRKARSHTSEVKEIQLSLKIDAHDLEVKSKRASGFLAEGDRVRIFMRLRGREMAFQDRARALMEEFRTRVGGAIEQPLTKLGNQFTMIVKKGKQETAHSKQ